VEHIPPFFFDKGTTIDNANFNYKRSIEAQFNKYIEEWINTVLQKRYDGTAGTLEKSYTEDVMENRELREEEREKKVTGVSVCYDLNELENINGMRDQILEEETASEVESEVVLFAMPDKLLRDISNRVTLLNH
jgi:hypothetical protein